MAARGSAVSSNSSPPLANALLVGAALVFGVSRLVARGALAWPPWPLLAGLQTLAGCLALVGPIVLWKRGGGSATLGELLWTAGGMLLWIFNAAELARGGAWRISSISWTAPVTPSVMGMVIFAVLLAGWRCGLSGRGWQWTNLVGWALGLFWIVAGLVGISQARSPSGAPASFLRGLFAANFRSFF